MPVESATYISDLNPTDPVHTDGLNQGDSHIRLIKSTLQATFPDITGPMTANQGALSAAGGAFGAPGYVQISPNGTVASGTLLLAGVVAGSNVQVTNTQTGTGDPGLAVLMVQGTTAVAPLTLTKLGVLATTGAMDSPSIRKGGNELIPAGIIVMWAGLTSNVPAGWHLCDGTNGTPDLIGMFIVGAGSGGPSAGQTGGTNVQSITTSAVGSHSHGGATEAVGNHDHAAVTTGFTLGIDHMPSHGHTLFDPGHQHYIGHGAASVLAGPNVIELGGPVSFDTTTQTAYTNLVVNATGGDQAHWHGIYEDGGHAHIIDADGAHSHTFGIDVRPTYYAICLIMKL